MARSVKQQTLPDTWLSVLLVNTLENQKIPASATRR